MNEQGGLLEDQSRTSRLPGSTSAGLLMRSAREASGLDISVLASMLKVPVNKIEALEADRFDVLPNLMFARALASSVCRSLKIDVASVLSLMPSSISTVIKVHEFGANTSFNAPRQGSRLPLWRQVSMPVVISFFLSFAAVLLFLLPVLPAISENEASLTLRVDETSQSRLNGLLPNGSAVRVNRDDFSDGSTVQTTSSSSSSENSDIPSVGNSVIGVPIALPAASEVVAGGAGLLVLTAKQTSWVQVVDALGVVQVRKTLQAGEAVNISGALPLAVVLGRADAVDVQVNGKPFKVTAREKENTARFEVGNGRINSN